MKPFELVVEEHGARVLRVCRAVVGPIDADDAWSETFLAALTAYPQLRPHSDVRAWLVTIAHRKAIDITRRRTRQPLPVGDLPEEPSRRGNPGEHDHDVWRLVAALPERQRLAVAYHYLAGLPHKETAEIIGGTADSVRRASADGIAALRHVYDVASPAAVLPKNSITSVERNPS